MTAVMLPYPARAGGEVVLVDNGQPRATIVVSARPVHLCNEFGRLDKTTQADAARQLQQFIEQSSGA